MHELQWLDETERLSATWKTRCESVFPTTDRYTLSRRIFEAVWQFNEWDLKILRECLEDSRHWMLFESHQRLKIEGIIKGFWVEECTTDDEVEKLLAVNHDASLKGMKLVTQKNFPKVRTILSRKDLPPHLAKHSEAYKSLCEGANDTAHMSLQLVWMAEVNDRKVWPGIRECLYQIGMCAMRVSRISWDKSHVSVIENECKEALTRLDQSLSVPRAPSLLLT